MRNIGREERKGEKERTEGEKSMERNDWKNSGEEDGNRIVQYK